MIATLGRHHLGLMFVSSPFVYHCGLAPKAWLVRPSCVGVSNHSLIALQW